MKPRHAFLTHLATERHVAPSTHKQALAALLEQVEPTFAPMVGLLCGAGLRLVECLRLRVKDEDFPTGSDRRIRLGTGACADSTPNAGLCLCWQTQ